MRLPVTQLDDRRFDDLVAEARQRLTSHLPDLQAAPEGDPIHALVDLFAFMTESVIYRANLIPERQRQAFLNLLQLPLRPATAATGLVSIDAKPVRNKLQVAPLLRAETVLREGDQTFTTLGDITSLPLGLKVLIKERIPDETLLEAGITPQQLMDQYGRQVTAFRPKSFVIGLDPIDLSSSLDGYLYLLLHLHDARFADQAETFSGMLAGKILNIGLAPVSDRPGDVAEEVLPRNLLFELAFQADANGQPTYLPLEVIDDSSEGGRKPGVVRLRLPKSAAPLRSTFADDPRQAGYGATPPEAPADVAPAQVMLWLRLSAPDESPLDLGYIDVNSVGIRGQGIVRNVAVGIGNGRPRQVVTLPHGNIEADSLILEVAELGSYRRWARVGHFASAGSEDRVFRLDPITGVVDFGDGVRGRRPEPQAAIRAAYYRHGGGVGGNLPAGTLRQIEADQSLYAVRQAWPLSGGIKAETIPEAEIRIPAFLTHRARAVTKADFSTLARDNPLTPVARAEAMPGLVPGANLAAARFDVPGAVSVFVMPPAPQALAAAPRPTVGTLRDVFQYLDRRKTIATELYVLSPHYVPVAISVAMTPIDPRTMLSVTKNLREMLLSFLWALAPGGPVATGWPFGRAIDPNELRTVAGRTEGVQSIDDLKVYHQDGDTGVWVELTESKLAFRPYQLPELMDVHVGSELAPPPATTQEDPMLPTPQAVPVAPDIC